MNDKLAFFDSNIPVYLVDMDLVKREKVVQLISPNIIISTQVVTENINACLKSLKLPDEEAYDHGQALLEEFNVVDIHPSTLQMAIKIRRKYQLSWWDSLIIATALENHCETLYSEDMQHGLVIENTLTIINPFL